MEDTEEQITMELETLETIYIHELEVFDKCENYVRTIKVDLKPATGENADAQWVYMELWFYIPVGYPDVLPRIVIKNPRGLSDIRLQRIEGDLRESAQSFQGTMMLYQLVEVAKDHLTEDNLPACTCAICLYGFTEDDVFVKTACFHYFHSHCLSRYIAFQLEEIRQKKEEAKNNNSPLKETLKLVCPMCRLEIPEDIVALPTDVKGASLPPPAEQETDTGFRVTAELRQLQQQMARLYLAQKERGGIIDIEGEKNKFFIQISNGDEDLQRSSRPTLTSMEVTARPVHNPHPTNAPTSKCSVTSHLSDAESNDTRAGNRAGRAGRRGKNGRMYPTPAEKKRAHLLALQQMRHQQRDHPSPKKLDHVEPDSKTSDTLPTATSGKSGRCRAGGGGGRKASS